MSNDLRFPIGEFDKNVEVTTELRRQFIATIEALPSVMGDSVAGLSDQQLDTEYRPGGWSIRQVVHHVADSHLNSFCRFKLALTEDVPTIRAYHEDRWAELEDSKSPVEESLRILDGVHSRWATLLRSMSDEDFKRKLRHPESGEWTLEKMLGLYDWHSKHHTAHITSLKKTKGW